MSRFVPLFPLVTPFNNCWNWAKLVWVDWMLRGKQFMGQCTEVMSWLNHTRTISYCCGGSSSGILRTSVQKKWKYWPKGSLCWITIFLITINAKKINLFSIALYNIMSNINKWTINNKEVIVLVEKICHTILLLKIKWGLRLHWRRILAFRLKLVKNYKSYRFLKGTFLQYKVNSSAKVQ